MIAFPGAGEYRADADLRMGASVIFTRRITENPRCARPRFARWQRRGHPCYKFPWTHRQPAPHRPTLSWNWNYASPGGRTNSPGRRWRRERSIFNAGWSPNMKCWAAMSTKSCRFPARCGQCHRLTRRQKPRRSPRRDATVEREGKNKTAIARPTGGLAKP